MRRIDLFSSLAFLTLVFACGGTEPTTNESRSEGFEETNVRTVEQASSWFRSDYVATIEPPASPWGDMQPSIYCDPGSWAIGYQLQVEGYRGSQDDTGLNSVRLLCQTPSGINVEWISAYNGWGTWGDTPSCPGVGNFITAARLRVEGYQGSRDDTAANDVEMGCRDGSKINTANGHEWGTWYDGASCPINTAVCGLAIRFEPYRGSSDDTAMNALRLHCCQL